MALTATAYWVMLITLLTSQIRVMWDKDVLSMCEDAPPTFTLRARHLLQPALLLV